MRPAGARQLRWILPFALYALFLWRTPYSLKSLPLRILDWAAPVALLGAWALGRWRRREPWPTTGLDRPLIFLALATGLTALFSVNGRNSLRSVWEVWLGILSVWAMVGAVRRGWGGVLWRVLYLMGGVVCLIGAIEFLAWYLGWPLLSSFQQGWPAIGGLSHPFPPTMHRLGLALSNTTALSAFVAMLIPPAITILLSTCQRDVRRGMLLWLIAAGAVELLALSRGGFLALAVSLPLLLVGSTGTAWFRRQWSAPRSRLPLAIATLLALVTMLGAGFWLAARLSSHSSGDAVRQDLWRSAIAMFGDHPLTGVGPAAYGTALRLYRDPLLARDHITTAHNLYLNTAAEGGLPGLLAGAWLLLALGRAWWRRWRAEAPGSTSWWRILGVGAALAGLAAQSLVDTFVEPAILLPAAFFAALTDLPKATTAGRPRRWPWLVALVVLALGAATMAWDDWGAALFARSLAWTQRGEVGKALSLVEQARSHDPGMSLYACHAGYLYGQEQAVATAIERYQECLAGTPVPGWVEQLNLAALLWQDGQPAQALTTARETTAQTPLEWLPWLNRGMWAEARGKWAEAVEAYSWVLALDPELAGSPFWQAGERADRWDDILTAGQQVAARLGWDQPPWRWQVLVAAGQSGQAAAEIETWLDTHHAEAEAMAWLGEAMLGLDRPTEAIAWLDRAISAQPSRARSYLVRGEAELALARDGDAERDLRTSLFLEPGYRAHLGLARLARQQGDEEAALQEYAQALRPLSLTQGYNVVLYHRLGWPVPLPQVSRIGYRQDGEAAREWGALLTARGEVETARRVYTATLTLDQFLDLPHVQDLDH